MSGNNNDKNGFEKKPTSHGPKSVIPQINEIADSAPSEDKFAVDSEVPAKYSDAGLPTSLRFSPEFVEKHLPDLFEHFVAETDNLNSFNKNYSKSDSNSKDVYEVVSLSADNHTFSIHKSGKEVAKITPDGCIFASPMDMDIFESYCKKDPGAILVVDMCPNLNEARKIIDKSAAQKHTVEFSQAAIDYMSKSIRSDEDKAFIKSLKITTPTEKIKTHLKNS